MHGAVIKFVPLIHSARVPKRAIEASLALAGLAEQPHQSSQTRLHPGISAGLLNGLGLWLLLEGP